MGKTDLIAGAREIECLTSMANVNNVTALIQNI